MVAAQQLTIQGVMAPSAMQEQPQAPTQQASGAAPENPDPADSSSNWTELVNRIRTGEPSGMEDLYNLFSRGVRFYFCRQLGNQELDDKVHDTFVIVVQAIQRGDLRDPERLMGFVRTVIKRQVAAYIDSAVHSRRDELDLELGTAVADCRRNPEQNAALRQKMEIMRKVMAHLSARDREILTRFYLYEQPPEQICEEMDLSDTQFRLLKSRAKARFGEIGRRKLQQKGLIRFFVRDSSSPEH